MLQILALDFYIFAAGLLKHFRKVHGFPFGTFKTEGNLKKNYVSFEGPLPEPMARGPWPDPYAHGLCHMAWPIGHAPEPMARPWSGPWPMAWPMSQSMARLTHTPSLSGRLLPEPVPAWAHAPSGCSLLGPWPGPTHELLRTDPRAGTRAQTKFPALVHRPDPGPRASGVSHGLGIGPGHGT